MASDRQRHRRRRSGYLGALRSAARPYRESELEVPVPDPGEGTPAGPGGPAPPSGLRAAGSWSRLATAPGAAADSVASADLLSSELARVFGSADAPLRTSYSAAVAAVRVGLRSEWVGTDPSIPAWTDWDYAVGTVGGQPYVLGRTARGLAVAVRRVLHGVGHRRLAPGAAWEVYPAASPTVALPTEGPRALPLRFFHGIGSGCGLMPAQTDRLDAWTEQNGLHEDGTWDLGHAWGRIATADPAGFLAHPEWSGGGDPAANKNKLCAYEPGLQAEALSWAQGRLAAVPDLVTVSLAAADGTLGWDAACSGTGEETAHTPSDRQLRLANYVQAQLRSAGSTAHVGVLAYGDMSAPPDDESVDPDLVVVYASRYMVQGQTPEQVRDAYVAAGAELVATYGYPSVWTADFDQPGVALATQRDALSTERDRLAGAVGWTGEGSPSWAPHGRWYWALAGFQFGEEPLDRWDAWPATAFPGCTTEATAWCDLVSARRALSTDTVHRLAQASVDLIDAAPTAAERARAVDLGRYAVAMDLQRRYRADPSATTLEPLLRWGYRVVVRDGADVVSYRCPYFTSPWATDRQDVADAYGLSDVSPFAPPWASLAGTTEGEVRAALVAAVAANALMAFTPVAYSRDLVLVSGLTHTSTRGAYVYSIRPTTWYLHPSGEVVFTIRGGMAFTNKGPDTVRIVEDASGEELVSWSIPPDKVARDYVAPTVAQRTYRVEVTPAGGCDLDAPVGVAMTTVLDESVAPFQASFSGYGYIPVGTTQIGFYANGGTVRWFRSDGVQMGSNVVAAQGYYSVPVDDGFDGMAVKVTGPVGKFAPLTIPPCIALDEGELLLPREVVEADGLTLADATPAPSRDYSVIEYAAPPDLVRPAGTLTASGARGDYIYFARPAVLWLSATGTSTTFQIKGGVASTTKGPDSVVVTDTVSSLVVATWSIPADKVVRDYVLPTTNGRLYRLDVTPAGGCDVDWAVGVRVVGALEASVSKAPNVGSMSAFFYVPAGLVRVGWYGDGGTVKVYDGGGTLRASYAMAHDFRSVAVPAGQDRRPWRFTGPVGRFEIETCPRSWARAPGELLLPAAVVAADGI